MTKTDKVAQSEINAERETHSSEGILPTPSESPRDDKNKQQSFQLNNGASANVKEVGGPKGLEPTRYGDWESKGRCYDF